MKRFYFLCTLLVLGIVGIYAQKGSSTYVDKKGVLRWTKGNAEVSEFGVHYALPFEDAYKQFAILNLPYEKGVEDDVYHLTRLGLKAFRLHLWDSEITDTLGNLVQNNHLHLVDYTISEMKKRGFKIIITPLTYYGTSEKPYGLGQKYGKKYSYTPECIAATKRYLKQIMEHVNSYTGVAYKDEPDIIGFELYNEPWHQNFTDEMVVPYINDLVQTIRKTGCKKPLFYCISMPQHVAKGIVEADIQGVTLQWYSVSHNAGFNYQGNLLTHVDEWPKSTLTDMAKAKHKTLISYELDAADNLYAYPYAMMARSMREAGFQFAAMFSYDPVGIAAYNSEFRTHFMNLTCTPQRALGLKIAGEVFRKVPRNTQFSRIPEDTIFDVFHVNHPQNLVEMLDEKKFFYTNSTSSMPPLPDKLCEIAGYGSSPVVNYEGRGAYFLDKLENGIWRLEIMPDATIIGNPFGHPNLNKEASAIVWEHYPMSINLKDLGKEFSVVGINEGNTIKDTAVDGKITAYPGTYLLVKKGQTSKWKPGDKWKDITLSEFVAPKATSKTYLCHTPVEEISKGRSHDIYAEVISQNIPDKVELFLSTYAPGGLRPITFQRISRYGYRANIPDNLIAKEDIIGYQIAITENGRRIAYPGNSLEWAADFINGSMYEVRIVDDKSPVTLFDVETDKKQIRRSHRDFRYVFHPSLIPGKLGLELGVNNLIYASSYLRNKIAGRIDNLNDKKQISLRAKALCDTPVKSWVILQQTNGLEYGAQIFIDKDNWEYSIPLTALKPIRITGPEDNGGVIIQDFDGKEVYPMSVGDIETIKLAVIPTDNGWDKKSRVVFEYVQLK